MPRPGGEGLWGQCQRTTRFLLCINTSLNTNPTKWAPSNLTVPVYYCTIMYHRGEGAREDKKRENQFVIACIMHLFARQGFVKPHG